MTRIEQNVRPQAPVPSAHIGLPNAPACNAGKVGAEPGQGVEQSSGIARRGDNPTATKPDQCPRRMAKMADVLQTYAIHSRGDTPAETPIEEAGDVD
jgi:hypothetical protein